jgi:hypothetical protein
MAAVQSSCSLSIALSSVVITLVIFPDESASRLFLLCSFYEAVFPELLNFLLCIFSETVFSERPSTAMCRTGLMIGLPMETVGGDGTRQIFPLSFHSISPVLINLNSKQTSYIYFHHYENL